MNQRSWFIDYTKYMVNGDQAHGNLIIHKHPLDFLHEQNGRSKLVANAYAIVLHNWIDITNDDIDVDGNINLANIKAKRR